MLFWKPRSTAQDAVGDRPVDLVHRANDPDQVLVVATDVAEGADPGHRSAEVLPDPDGGVDHVYSTRADLDHHLAGPVVYLQAVDDHGLLLSSSAPGFSDIPGLGGSTQSSVTSGPMSSSRGAPWKRVTRSQSVDLGL